jgi:hypothetical protein
MAYQLIQTGKTASSRRYAPFTECDSSALLGSYLANAFGLRRTLVVLVEQKRRL